RITTTDRVRSRGAVYGHIIRWARRNKVRIVITRPRTRAVIGVGVPPHISLAFTPGLTIGIGRGAVIQDPSVRRPGPTPFRCHPMLLLARLTAGRLVHAVGIDTAIDPASARRRTVLGKLGVGRQHRTVRPGTVNFL